jgi:hypothetical protein
MLLYRGVLRTGAHMGKDLSAIGELEYQAAGAQYAIQYNARQQRPPAWLNLNMNQMRPNLNISENMFSLKQKMSDRFSFGGRSNLNGAHPGSQGVQATSSPSASQQIYQQQNGGSSGIIDDPISTLLGPVSSLAADATSGMMSMMAFPYLTSAVVDDGKSSSSHRQHPEECVPQQYLPKTPNPNPMSQPQGLTPVNLTLTGHKPGVYWSGGVDLNNIHHQPEGSRYGITGTGETGVIAMYEQLRLVVSGVSQRLLELAGAVEESGEPPDSQKRGYGPEELSSLSFVLEGTLSLEEYDKRFGFGKGKGTKLDQPSALTDGELSMSAAIFAESSLQASNNNSADNFVDNIPQGFIISSAAAAASELSPNYGNEPSDIKLVSLNMHQPPCATDDVVGSPSLTGSEDGYFSSPTSDAAFRPRNGVIDGDKKDAYQPKYRSPGEGYREGSSIADIVTSPGRIGFDSEKPVIVNSSLLDSLIGGGGGGSPSLSSQSGKSSKLLSLTTFDEEKQKNRLSSTDIDSIFR